MGAMKNYMMELSEKLGKDFYEITDRDMELDMFNASQEVFANGPLDDKELENAKKLLPTKTTSDASEVGNVVMDNSGTFNLMTL